MWKAYRSFLCLKLNPFRKLFPISRFYNSQFQGVLKTETQKRSWTSQTVANKKHYGQGKLLKVVPKNPRDPMVPKLLVKFESLMKPKNNSRILRTSKRHLQTW